jgi:hypothetical protein
MELSRLREKYPQGVWVVPKDIIYHANRLTGLADMHFSVQHEIDRLENTFEHDDESVDRLRRCKAIRRGINLFIEDYRLQLPEIKNEVISNELGTYLLAKHSFNSNDPKSEYYLYCEVIPIQNMHHQALFQKLDEVLGIKIDSRRRIE